MKHMKKLLGLILTFVMVFAMTTTTFAATIIISKGASGSEYAAYKLLNATHDGNDKFAYTLNEKYAGVLKEVTGEETEAAIMEYISELDDDGTREFADAVYAKVKDMTPEYTTQDDKFENVAQGYYLIAETKTGNDEDTYSLVMLDTAGEDDITVETKEDAPTLEKKVQEKNDSTGDVSDWQDGADYDIGDDVPFKLTGTVSDKYDDYETYYYVFHDEMSAGLTFNADSVVVKIDGKVVNPTAYDVVTTGLTDGCTFEVKFEDLKKVVTEDNTKVTAASEITVEFTAKLNEKAEIGTPGNPNEAKLEYNNNPYGTGKGETPKDKVVVFTYKLNADKVDGEGNPLEDAGFTLYKWKNTAAEGEEAVFDWVAAGDEITGVTTFTFTGLDAGKYKLVETTVPAGYNKADDICFTIEAVYDEDSDDPELKALIVKDADGNVISEGEDAVFKTNITEGYVNIAVENNSGTELPSTGGIGTTIFYVVGGLLMAVAAVLLITKKKMAGKEN